MIEAAREFKQIAKSRVEGRTLASPAVEGKSILLRSDTHLYRIEALQ